MVASGELLGKQIATLHNIRFYLWLMEQAGKEIKKRVNSNNICIAGGVALNSVANQKLFDATNFKEIFIFPACSDAGVPFGLALWGLYNFPKVIKKRPKMNTKKR